AMAVTPDSPATFTGISRFSVVPPPSRPYSPLPQQWPPPCESKAQLWEPPVAMFGATLHATHQVVVSSHASSSSTTPSPQVASLSSRTSVHVALPATQVACPYGHATSSSVFPSSHAS